MTTGTLAHDSRSEDASNPDSAHRSTSSVTVKTARETFAALVDRSFYRGERFVLTKHGKPHAVIISPQDLELLRQVENTILAREARKVRDSLGEESLVPFDAIRDRS